MLLFVTEDPVGGGAPPAGAPGPQLPVPVPAPSRAFSAPATSVVNLLGRLETWGVTPATQVRGVSLRVKALNGAQLKKLLEKLPDGLTYELDLEREET